MKVLITGGAGFIGAHLARALRLRGDDVVIVDDFNAYYDPTLKRARVEALLGSDMPVVEADVADRVHLNGVLREIMPHAVVHFAAWAGILPSRAHPELFTRANVLGTVNVFDACAHLGIPRILFASSSSVYGPVAPVPSPEAELGGSPASVYGVTKRAGEAYAALYHELEELRITCLRFFTVYGSWGRPDMAVWKFTERILRGEPIPLNVRSADGQEVRRDFTDVSDVVRACVAALDADRAFEIVNVGAADSVSLRRLVRAVEVATGRDAHVEERVLPPGEAVSTGADLTRAGEVLGYRPTVRIEGGVKTFASWYKAEFLERFPTGLAPSPYWS